MYAIFDTVLNFNKLIMKKSNKSKKSYAYSTIIVLRLSTNYEMICSWSVIYVTTKDTGTPFLLIKAVSDYFRLISFPQLTADRFRWGVRFEDKPIYSSTWDVEWNLVSLVDEKKFFTTSKTYLPRISRWKLKTSFTYILLVMIIS